MRRSVSVLLAFLVAVVAATAAAGADPKTAEPPTVRTALLTLTTIPEGWQSRTDLRPVLEVYSDGHAVYRPDAIAADRKADTEPRQVAGTVRAEVLKAALTEVQALSETDFGVPATNDHGIGIIDFMPEALEQSAHLIVYSPSATEGFAGEQQSARTRFAAVWRSLVDGFVAD
ncbi:hypothetical protein ACWEKT_31890 [Nocardia takedensis]